LYGTLDFNHRSAESNRTPVASRSFFRFLSSLVISLFLSFSLPFSVSVSALFLSLPFSLSLLSVGEVTNYFAKKYPGHASRHPFFFFAVLRYRITIHFSITVTRNS
jgi:hypothetical protein